MRFISINVHFADYGKDPVFLFVPLGHAEFRESCVRITACDSVFSGALQPLIRQFALCTTI